MTRRERFPRADMRKQLAGIRSAREAQHSGEREAAEFHKETQERELREALDQLESADRSAYESRRQQAPFTWGGGPNPTDVDAHRRAVAYRLLDAGKSVEEILAHVNPPRERPQHAPGDVAPLPTDNSAPTPDAGPDWRSIIADRIKSEDYSYNALGLEAGVDPAVVMRFVKGERDIRLETAEKLCAALDLVLVPREWLDDGMAG